MGLSQYSEGKVKKSILVLVLVFLAFSASCQNYHPSPQTVTWNAPTEDYGTIRYEVAVIERGADEADPANYLSISIEPDLVELIDLEALGLTGEYVVTVRVIRDYQGNVEVTDWIYANRPPPDTDETEGPFFIYRIPPLGKALGLKIQ